MVNKKLCFVICLMVVLTLLFTFAACNITTDDEYQITVHPENGDADFVWGVTTEFPELTKEGYELSGLYLDKECTNAVTIEQLKSMELTENIDIYVKWTEVEVPVYTVTVHPSNDGEDVAWHVGDEVPTFKKVGYIVDGFYIDAEYTTSIELSSSLELTQDIEVWVKWVECTEHSGRWITDKTQNCTEAGSRHRTCTICGLYVEEPIPATGHNMYHNDKVEPTCTKEGVKENWFCSYCSKYFADEKGETELTSLVIEKKEHSLGEWIEEVPATCVSYGVKGHYQCADCKKYFDADEKQLSDLSIAPTGHKLTHHDGFDANCTENGSKEYWSCSECGKNYSDAEGKNILNNTVIPAKGHSYDEFIGAVEPTCSTEGVVAHLHCEVCNKNFDNEGNEIANVTIPVDSTKHNYGEWIEKVDATCTHSGNVGHYYCAICQKNFDAEYNVIDDVIIRSNGHIYGEWIAEVDATCTEDGIKGHYHCSVCDKDLDAQLNILDNIAISALGHNSDGVVAHVDATCTNAGVVGGHFCTRCNEGKTEAEAVIEALGHSYGELIAEVPATCEGAGSKAHYHCANCGVDFDADKNALESIIIDKLSHNMTHHEGVAATCVDDGNVEYYSCSVCGKNYADEEGNEVIKNVVIEALGHSYDDYSAEVPATCLNEGKKAYIHCATCDKYFDPQTNVELDADTLVIAKLSHDMTHHEKVEATCTEDGIKEYYSCSKCGIDYADEEGNEVLTSVVIEAIGHDMTHHKMVLPTCTEEGVVEYWSCSNCEKNFADKYGKNELDDLSIEANGHNYGEWIEKVDATCVATGIKGHYHCSVCDVNFDENKDILDNIIIAINPNGHHFGEWIEEIDSNCTESGVKGHKVCELCQGNYDIDGVIIEDLTIAPKGHDYGEWIEVVEATCTENGVKGHYTCSVCSVNFDAEHNILDSLTINALGHAMTEHKAVSATCTADGNIAYWTCGNCNKIFTDKNGLNELSDRNLDGTVDIQDTVEKAYGHSFTAQTETHLKSAATCENNAVYYINCKHCGLSSKGTELENTFEKKNSALGHNIVLDKAQGVNGYLWAEDYSSCVAYGKCNRSGCTHSVEVNATISSKETQNASCILPELTKYTASFNVTWATAQVKANIQTAGALGHNSDGTIAHKDADCINDGVVGGTYCTRCNDGKTAAEAVIPALGHNSEGSITHVDATCTNPGVVGGHYCTRCNNGKAEAEATIDALGHDYGTVTYNWDKTKGSSCIAVRSCTKNCGEEGHAQTANSSGCDYDFKPATCIAYGQGQYTFYFAEKWASGYTTDWFNYDTYGDHKYGEWIAEKPATCTSAGEKGHYHCSVCGTDFDTDKSELSDLTISAKGHSFTTLNHDKNFHWYECANTGCTEISGKVAHTWNDGVVTKDPTESEEGEKTYTCTLCGETKVENIGTLGHTHTFDETKWEGDENGHWHPATCGHTSEKSGYAAHSGGTATCTDKAVCEICGKPYGELASEHDYTSSKVTYSLSTDNKNIYATRTCINCDHSETATATWFSYNGGTVTCTQDGTRDFYVEFDEEWANTDDLVYIPTKALGHNTDGVVDHKDPDCINTGVEGGTYCTRCEEGKAAAETVIPAKGHNSDGVVVHVEPDCINDGVVGGTYCTRCNEGKTAAEAVIPALGHNSEGSITHVDATCTNSGVVGGHYCTRCNNGKAEAEATIDALGHAYGTVTYNWDKTKGSSCIAVRSCTKNCGEEGYTQTANSSGYDYDFKPATCIAYGQGQYTFYFAEKWASGYTTDWFNYDTYGDHKYGEWIAEKPATCTSAGEKGHYHCSVCGTDFDTDKSELSAEQIVIAKLSHSMTYHEEVAASDTADGTVEYWACSSCESNYADEQGNTKLDSVVIHNYNDYGVCSNCSYASSIEFEEVDGEIHVKGIGDFGGTILVIPNEYNGKPVTTIDANAFQENIKLVSVTIPNIVTSIGKQAFDHCSNLKDIIFEDGSTLKTIGEKAFCYAGITSVEIPASVTTLDTGVFWFCQSLTSVTFAENSHLTTIGENFVKWSAITEITIPASVTHIGSYSFAGCSNLTSLTFEDTLGWYGYPYFRENEAKLIDVSDPTLNAYEFRPSDGRYAHYHWYKKVCSEHSWGDNDECTVCGKKDPSKVFYLIGYIEDNNYGCEEDATNLGDYKFVNGSVVVDFTSDAYVFVKAETNSAWYMTDGWLGEVKTATLYNTTDKGISANKLYVPGNSHVTFTLEYDKDNDTITLSYTYTCTTHNWADATCTEPKTCSRCGATEGEAHGHNYVTWTSNGDGTHTSECTYKCGVDMTEDCSGGTATCISSATCTKCGGSHGSIDPGNHEENLSEDWESDANGHWHEYTCCHVKGEVIDHTPNVDAATEDTDKHCTVCGYIIDNKLTHEHNFGEWIDETPATCTDNGEKAHYHCSTCNKNYESDKITLIEDIVITALGHNYGTWIDEDPASCEATGTKAHYHCAACGTDFDGDKNVLASLKIDATGHSYVWTDNGDGTHTGECRKDTTHTVTESHTIGDSHFCVCGKEQSKLYMYLGSTFTGWRDSSAWFAAYFFEGDNNTWYEMTLAGSDNVSAYLYECYIPDGYSNVIFARMKPEKKITDGWSAVWNQTNDLTIPTDGKNCIQVTGWDSSTDSSKSETGDWFTYVPNKFYVVGDEGLTGANWSIIDDNLMSFDKNEKEWTFTYNDVKSGTYKFKVKDSLIWYGNKGADVSVTVSNDHSIVTITFDPSNFSVDFNVNEYQASYKITRGETEGDAVNITNGTFNADLQLGDIVTITDNFGYVKYTSTAITREGEYTFTVNPSATGKVTVTQPDYVLTFMVGNKSETANADGNYVATLAIGDVISLADNEGETYSELYTAHVNGEYTFTVDTENKTVNCTKYPGSTKENPLSIAEAINAAEKLGTSQYSSCTYYIQGTVSEVGSNDDKTKGAKISNDGSSIKLWEISWDDDSLSSAWKILHVGDTIVINGYLYNYQGNTPEIDRADYDKKSIITSITHADSCYYNEAKNADSFTAISEEYRADCDLFETLEIYGVTINVEWSGSVDGIIDGKTIKQQNETVTFTLTATLKREDSTSSDTWSKEIKVIGLDEINQAIVNQAKTEFSLGYTQVNNEGKELPATTTVDGKDVSISWTCDPSSYLSDGKTLVLPESGRVKVTLTAEFTLGEATATQSYEVVLSENGLADRTSGYFLVTDVSELSAGDTIIIVAKDSEKAMGTLGTNNRTDVDVTKNGSTLTFSSDSYVQIITLQSGTIEGTFAFNVSGYLYAASSDKNHLKTETKLSDNSSWTIAIASDGTATITAQGSNKKNLLKYNQTSSIFSCYGSGQKDIVIYKYSTILDTPVVSVNQNNGEASWNPVLDASGYKYSVDGGNNWSKTTVSSVSINAGETIIVKAIGSGIFADSAASSGVEYIKVVSLGAPEVVYDNETGVVAITPKDEKAIYGYKYQIVNVADNGEYPEFDITSASNYDSTAEITISAGQRIYVVAIGDGLAVGDGHRYDNSTVVYATRSTLVAFDAPTNISISDDGLIISWDEVSGVTVYIYKIGSGDEVEVTTNSVTLETALEDNAVVYIKAKGNNTTNSDSTFASATYRKPIQLVAPVVTIDPLTNVASWNKVSDATEYTIVSTDDTKSYSAKYNEDTSKYEVEVDYDVIITVKANGYTKDGIKYLDSAESDSVTPVGIITIAETKEKDKNTYVKIQGVVTSIDYAWNNGSMSVYIKDSSDSIYIYKLATKVEVNNIITVYGQVGEYNDAKQIAAGATATIDGNHVSHEAKLVDATDSTCTTKGNNQYYECSVCGKKFTDEACTTEATDADIYKDLAAHKAVDGSSHPAVDATCSATGTYAYYTCEYCGNYIITSEGGIIVVSGDLDNTIAPQAAHTDENGDGICDICSEAVPVTVTIKHNVTTSSVNMSGNNDAETYFDLDSSIFTIKSVITSGDHAGLNKGGNVRIYKNSSLEVSVTAEYKIIKVKVTINTGSKSKDYVVKVGDANIVAYNEYYTIDSNSFTITNTNTTSALWIDSIELWYVTVPHTHTLTYVVAKDSTCEVQGNIEYYECSDCGKKFSDSEGSNQITTDVNLPLSATHTEGTSVSAKAPTCTDEGNYAYYICSVCSKYIITKDEAPVVSEDLKDTVIDIVDHSTDTDHTFAAKPATCTESGNIAYYQCTMCDKYFKSSDNEEVLLENVSIAPTGVHVDDNSDNVCDNCGASMSNIEGVKLSAPEIKIDANGKVTWEDVENASGYKYQVKAKDATSYGDENDCTSGSIILTDGQSIKIWSVGNGTATLDSDHVEKVCSRSFVKATSGYSFNGESVLIVYEADSCAFNGSLGTLDAANNNQSVTITNYTIAYSADMEKYTFTISSKGVIQSKSGYYIGKTSNVNGLDSNEKTQYTNTVNIESDGSATIKSSGGAYLRYNANIDQKRFRYFRSSSYTNQKAIAIYVLTYSLSDVSE